MKLLNISVPGSCTSPGDSPFHNLLECYETLDDVDNMLPPVVGIPEQGRGHVARTLSDFTTVL